MSLINCPACGHMVAVTAKACPSCGGKITPPQLTFSQSAGGCLIALVAGLLLFVALPWGCSKLFPEPKSPEEALTRAGYTEVERAFSQMDCRDNEWKLLPFSAFKAGEYVMGVVCKSRNGGSYRIQSRAWNEDADGISSLRDAERIERQKSAKSEMDSRKEMADFGDANSQTMLGIKYANGDGVPKDNAKAVELWQKAAAQGYGPAQANLAMHLIDNGSLQDLVAGYAWALLASRSSDEFAPDIARQRLPDYEAKLKPADLKKATQMADNWKPGEVLTSK